MNQNAYDSKAAIQLAIRSLPGLQALVNVRRRAGYGRKEKMQACWILGRFFLDCLGNFKKIEGVDLKVKFPEIPDVLTDVEFGYFVLKRDPGMWISLTEASLPPGDMTCPICGKGWDITNCHDVYVQRETTEIHLDWFVGETLARVKAIFQAQHDRVYFMQRDKLIRNDRFIDRRPRYPNPKDEYERRAVVNQTGWRGYGQITDEYVIAEGDTGYFNIWTYFHHGCHRQYRVGTFRNRFTELFLCAGFENFAIVPTIDDDCDPCFNVTTNFGVIRIGVRPRVFVIDWSSLNYRWLGEIVHLFMGEGTTFSNSGIHAWGWDKAGEYLRKIYDHLVSKTRSVEPKPLRIHRPWCEGGAASPYPLSKRQIELLLRQAQQTGDRKKRDSIGMRLLQAIPTRKCPETAYDDMSARQAEVTNLYLGHGFKRPTPTLVNQIYNAIYR